MSRVFLLDDSLNSFVSNETKKNETQTETEADVESEIENEIEIEIEIEIEKFHLIRDISLLQFK